MKHRRSPLSTRARWRTISATSRSFATSSAESHWGSESKEVHSTYEAAVERSIDFTTRKSSLLDPFIKEITIGGDTPETVTLAVARHTERGNSDRTPRWMHTRYRALIEQGKIADTSWRAKVLATTK